MPISTHGPTTGNHELLTDEVQEVISYRPHWIVRRGNTLFLGILLLLLGLTWLIQYPDKITTDTKLVALNPPKLVVSKTEGKLVKLLVTNEQQVRKGQVFGYMESTASYEEVSALQNWIHTMINSLQDNDYSMLLKNMTPRLSRLGELQIDYQGFQNQMEITKQTLASGYYEKKRNALQKDIAYLNNLKSNSAQQQQLQEQNKQLGQKEYEAYEKLAKEKVIAPLELNQYKSKLIDKEQGLKQLNAQITNSDISIHGKQKEILDLEKLVADQHQQFYSSLLDLKSQVEKWMQQYVLIAPENGKAVFVSSLQENEMISNGQSLFYIQPEQTKFYAELMAGQQGLGKVKTGQRVMIRVESYPSNEFGYLAGTVSYISNIPNRRDSFLIKVDLPGGLKTNYGKTLFFRNGLIASAEIITDSRRLFERLTGQLKQVLKK